MTDHDDTITAAGEAFRQPARAVRSKVLKGAHIAFNSEFSAIPCTIRNISDSGAQLIVEGGWFIPDRFTLHVEIDGFKVECQRVRQKGSECGVRFLSERIRTGAPRQQVLTPETSDAEAPRREPAPQPRETGFAAPLHDAHARPGGGFGRRTR